MSRPRGITAGNPTSTNGLLYDISTVSADLWNVVVITADPDDPKRTPRVDIAHAREQIEKYGRPSIYHTDLPPEDSWLSFQILSDLPVALHEIRNQVRELVIEEFPKALHQNFMLAFSF